MKKFIFLGLIAASLAFPVQPFAQDTDADGEQEKVVLQTTCMVSAEAVVSFEVSTTHFQPNGEFAVVVYNIEAADALMADAYGKEPLCVQYSSPFTDAKPEKYCRLWHDVGWQHLQHGGRDKLRC